MTKTVKPTPAMQAAQFVSRCSELGWKIESVSDSVVTITKRFRAGDRDALVECDMEYYSILSLAALRGGSIWGTDCGGVGAISALNNGVFRMNKSGTGKRFTEAVRKAIR
jgi:hypothetical protein